MLGKQAGRTTDGQSEISIFQPMGRQGDRMYCTDRLADTVRLKDRWISIWMDRWMDRWKDGKTDRETDI